MAKDSTENLEKDNLITPDGYKRLHDEMRRLWDVDRPKIVTEVSWAAAQGDRSENAEYIYGKRKLREIDSRVRFLQKRLDRAKIIDPKKQAHDTIQFGATVTLRRLDIEDESARTYDIVGEDEVDPSAKKISWRSPVGRALLNRRVGDIVEIEVPTGSQEFEVLNFIYK